MKLSSYLYTGPQSAATLRVSETTELLEVQLVPGRAVELPAGHEYVEVLLALKHLELLPGDASKSDAPAISQPDDKPTLPVTKGAKT